MNEPEYVSDTLGALRSVLPPVDIGNPEQMGAVEVLQDVLGLMETLHYAQDVLRRVPPEDRLDEVHRHAVEYLDNESLWVSDAYIQAAKDILRLVGQPVPPEPGAHAGNDGGDFVGYLLPTPESLRFAADRVAAEEASA